MLLFAFSQTVIGVKLVLVVFRKPVARCRSVRIVLRQRSSCEQLELHHFLSANPCGYADAHTQHPSFPHLHPQTTCAWTGGREGSHWTGGREGLAHLASISCHVYGKVRIRTLSHMMWLHSSELLMEFHSMPLMLYSGNKSKTVFLVCALALTFKCKDDLISFWQVICEVQCLAKVFDSLELCDLLPHFRLQT